MFLRTLICVATVAHYITLVAARTGNNIMEILYEKSEFSTLVDALEETGLDEFLSDPDAGVTLLAPTNSAFSKLPAGAIDNLSFDALTNLLSYHVLTKEWLAPPGLPGSDISVLKQGNFKYATARTNEEPNEIKIDVDGNNVMAKNAPIVQSSKNMLASNGVIHALSEVIANQSIRNPMTNPTRLPTRKPTHRPTKVPTRRPTKKPTRRPTKVPTRRPRTRRPRN